MRPAETNQPYDGKKEETLNECKTRRGKKLNPSHDRHEQEE
jgi:hypothetical protein